MATQLKPISNKARKLLAQAVEAIREEGHHCWGFTYNDNAKDGREQQVILDVFNSHDEPLPLFIVRTKAAIAVIGNSMPEGFDLAKAEQDVVEVVQGKVSHLPGDLAPHIINPKKVN